MIQASMQVVSKGGDTRMKSESKACLIGYLAPRFSRIECPVSTSKLRSTE